MLINETVHCDYEFNLLVLDYNSIGVGELDHSEYSNILETYRAKVIEVDLDISLLHNRAPL